MKSVHLNGFWIRSVSRSLSHPVPCQTSVFGFSGISETEGSKSSFRNILKFNKLAGANHGAADGAGISAYTDRLQLLGMHE